MARERTWGSELGRATMPRMAPIRPDAALTDDWAAMPVLWQVQTALLAPADYSDEVLARYLPGGRGKSLRSFGHDDDGVHWLLTRAGTPLHHDPAYARYSHQLVLRNDGNRVRGLPRYDQPDRWHPQMVPGAMYALDTHSPHQGLPDPRFGPKVPGPTGILKLVIAVDRDELLTPAEVLPMLRRLVGRELPETGQTTYAAPRKWGAAS
jgi:hypothetical protein